jgi:hypothetical protein
MCFGRSVTAIFLTDNCWQRLLLTARPGCCSHQLARAAAKEALAPLLAAVAGRLAFVLRQAFAIATQGAGSSLDGAPGSCVLQLAAAPCARAAAAVGFCSAW